jgi:hypothetical protein
MTIERFCYPPGKKNYQVLDKAGDKARITLDKCVADIFQIELSDVHGRIQKAFDKMTKRTLMRQGGLEVISLERWRKIRPISSKIQRRKILAEMIRNYLMPYKILGSLLILCLFFTSFSIKAAEEVQICAKH